MERGENRLTAQGLKARLFDWAGNGLFTRHASYGKEQADAWNAKFGEFIGQVTEVFQLALIAIAVLAGIGELAAVGVTIINGVIYIAGATAANLPRIQAILGRLFQARPVGISALPIPNKPAVPVITVSRSAYPESAAHIEDAQAAGFPKYLVINRPGAAANRSAWQGLRNPDGTVTYPVRPNLARDEYPPAMFSQGGANASIRYMSPGDNSGAGASIGNQCRPYANGTIVCIVVGP